ncbi:hypothetical protein [Segatella baroniae]|uniref:hypothetical protein n=1 Tax=Segatella baroniae TaxID=305719 RepID=UPI0028EC5C35|nr:hypothetical protein [Segatella baroniae]
MKNTVIITKILSDFSTVYRNASPFVNSGALWNFCMSTIADPVQMEKIVFANDLGIPPVKSLLLIYERTMHPVATFVFAPTESRCMGALMGFVFKNVLGYTTQQERCSVKKYGVKTATRFMGGYVPLAANGRCFSKE